MTDVPAAVRGSQDTLTAHFSLYSPCTLVPAKSNWRRPGQLQPPPPKQSLRCHAHTGESLATGLPCAFCGGFQQPLRMRCARLTQVAGFSRKPAVEDAGKSGSISDFPPPLHGARSRDQFGHQEQWVIIAPHPGPRHESACRQVTTRVRLKAPHAQASWK